MALECCINQYRLNNSGSRDAGHPGATQRFRLGKDQATAERLRALGQQHGLEVFDWRRKIVVEVIPAAKRADKKRIALNPDQTVAPKSPVELKLLSEVGKQGMIFSDAYASKPGSMSYCQAGQEEFLRDLTVETRMREKLHLKLRSYIASLELASPCAVWKPESSALEIHWLSGPGPTNIINREVIGLMTAAR